MRRTLCQHWNSGMWCTTSHARTVPTHTLTKLVDRSLHVWKNTNAPSDDRMKLFTHPTLPDDRPRILLGQSVRHRKRDHETYARFYRDMEHNLHMHQSMRKTRSRLQSSTRLLAVTKAMASLNQLTNFNSSAESHIPDLLVPTLPRLPWLFWY